MYLLGIDLGTTGCKSMVLAPDGRILGEHTIEYNLIFTADGVEQDAEGWWQHVQDTVRAAIGKAGIDGRQVAALSASSQGIAFVPVDRQGRTLMNALSWYDTRSAAEAGQLRQDPGAELLSRRTGRRIGPLVFPQVMWLRQHRPEIYAQTWKCLMCLDFLQYRLCGEAVTDYSMASGTLCYDVAEKAWIGPLFARYGIDQAKMPEIGCFGDVIGTVLPDVARRLGLSEKTKVVLGLQDQKSAALGAGIQDGIITVSLGTASAISSLTAGQPHDPRALVFCHGFDRTRKILESCVATAGSALRWVRDTFFPDLGYPELNQLAEQSPPGAQGLFFHPLLTPAARPEEMGRLTGIQLGTTRSAIARAVLEGVAFEISERIEAHQAINPLAGTARELHLFGGGAASPVWCRILADITGLDVRVPSNRETAALGAALCAGVGSGIYADAASAQAACNLSWSRYPPQAEQHRIYRLLMDDYMALRHAHVKME